MHVAPGLSLARCTLRMPVVSLGREILGARKNLQGSGPARWPGWRRWPWGQTGGQRSQRTGRLPHGCPREPLWEPGPLGPWLLAVRAHSYSISTCDVAVLPEAGLVTEEGWPKASVSGSP